MVSGLIRKDSNAFVKKPLPVGVLDWEETATLKSAIISSSYESIDDDSENSTNSMHTLERHLTLLDLGVIGVGCTLGSGLFVLSGLVASEYAGPASSLSWAIAGMSACLSGSCYAELSARIPLAGSAYAYTFVAMGELPAVLAAACLSLDYIAAASAVSRSWGDKVMAWIADEFGPQHWLASMSGSFVNPFAFLVSSASVGLLMHGVKESKSATHFFTALKVTLVAFMIIVGTFYVDSSNWSPFIPPQFGVNGVLRGATGTFFGYLGYDEIAVLGAEARNPKRDLPRAILGTIGSVTFVYMVAAIVLTGMVPYQNISSVSGFPEAFRENDLLLTSRITAIGEIITLPIVVLITIMGQPRLQFALSQDGLLPQIFGEIDGAGNLSKGTMICGVVIIVVSTVVPFYHLNDMVSCAVLTALSLTDTSLIILWHPSPPTRPGLAESMMGLFHGLALSTGVILSHFLGTSLGRAAAVVGMLSMIACIIRFVVVCPRSKYFGSTVHTHPSAQQLSTNDGYFRTPLVPMVPCLGIFMNWYLVSQLELRGIILHLGFLAFAAMYYLFYAIKHSVGNNGGW